MKLKLSWLLTVFMALMIQFSFAQEKTITGTVTGSEDGLPLPGVSVLVKGTTRGVQTDFDGNYSLNASVGETLVFSFLGNKTVESVVGSSNVINIAMEPDAAALDEVVVVAYGSQSKKKVISSISTISTEDLEDLQVESPQDVLQGQASGVQVTSSSGLLGSAPVVRIRGNTSISSGSRPLFVIDGVPLGDNFLTGGQGGAQGINPLSSINPNDIASISVLKSASATAVYGSRGANGVVLITTKSGTKDGKVNVTLDVNTSYARATDTPDLLNAAQFIAFSAATNRPRTDNGGDFDFIDAVLRQAVSQTYNLSVNGGNENANYFIGVTREEQEGILVGNELERTSIRANVTTRAKDWLTVGANTNVSLNRFDRTPTSNAFASPYTIANLQRPDINPIDANGNFTTAGNVGGGNVIAQELFNLNLATTTRIIGNVFGEVDFSSIIDGLKFKSDFGVDRTSTEQQQRNIDLLSPGGFASNSIFQQNRYIATNTLSYTKQFGEKHNLNVIGGISYEQNDTRGISVSGTGFLSDDLINVDSASTFPTTSSNGSTSRLFSQFVRGTYDYENGKYLAEAAVRRDGSSRFGQNEQNGVFWSGALGWNVSDENFMQDVDWIEGLKVNVSAGTAGNDRIGNFAFLGTFFVSPFNGNSGLRPVTLPNPDLKWESTTSFDAGISASFFNRRLTVGVEYYKRITDDLILNVPLDPTFNNGLNGRFENVGEVENRGFDVDISSINIDSGDFRWTTNLNLGFNTNEVTELPDTAQLDLEGRRFIPGGGFSGQRAILGESINSFFLIRYVGVNSQTGDAEWLDRNGNITTNPTQDDRVFAGDAVPDVVGGLTNTFTYKNWSLNTLFNFSIGNDVYLATRGFSENPRSGFNKTTRVLNIWQNPGDNAFLPSVNSTTFGIFEQDSTQQLEDASYLRLKNITLSYNLPQSILEGTFISNVRFYGTSTNLFTVKGDGLDGFDPEVSRGAGTTGVAEDFFNVPQARSFSFGVNVSF